MANSKDQESNYTVSIGAILILAGFIYMVYMFINLNTAPIWPFFTLIALGILIVKSNSKNIASPPRKRFELNRMVHCGKYVYGHYMLEEPFEPAMLYIKQDIIKLYEGSANNAKFKLNIDIPSIESVTVEDKTTISKRVGLKRMAVFGLFAFAMKKKVINNLAYIVINYKNSEDIPIELFFEIKENDAIRKAHNAKVKIQKAIAAKN